MAKIQAHFSIAEMGQVVGQNEKDQKTKSIAPSLKWGKWLGKLSYSVILKRKYRYIVDLFLTSLNSVAMLTLK